LAYFHISTQERYGNAFPVTKRGPSCLHDDNTSHILLGTPAELYNYVRIRTATLIKASSNAMPRTLDNTVDYDEDEPRQFVSNDQLADLTGRSKSWISDCARGDYLLDGMPLAQWAVQDRYGQIQGFDVPESILKGLRRAQEFSNS